MQKPLEEVINELRQIPHIVLVEPAEKWDLPEIEASKFDPNEKEWVDEILGTIRNFLSSPYIVDDFVDHKERREWRGTDVLKCSFDAQWYYHENALRVQTLASAIRRVGLLQQRYQGRDREQFNEIVLPVSEAMKGLRTPERVTYDDMTNTQKYEFAKDLKQKVYAAMKFLAD